LFYAGSRLPENVHVAVNLLNEVLKNTELYHKDQIQKEFIAQSSLSDFEGLISRMNNKQVDVLIHYDSNPVYHLPTDLGYSEA